MHGEAIGIHGEIHGDGSSSLRTGFPGSSGRYDASNERCKDLHASDSRVFGASSKVRGSCSYKEARGKEVRSG